ncbi:hypothetical protein DPMN_124145 [Dreissena polymorpha]|uniref:Uncharacterized protein n=1 Tax=Dreissena polymorpha TaxID=45954 RepID=A0A9D4JVZ4_DREPO|nr:hypothetical protein DPMN_124145 [Dreissena polymorpha]
MWAEVVVVDGVVDGSGARTVEIMVWFSDYSDNDVFCVVMLVVVVELDYSGNDGVGGSAGMEVSDYIGNDGVGGMITLVMMVLHGSDYIGNDGVVLAVVVGNDGCMLALVVLACGNEQHSGGDGVGIKIRGSTVLVSWCNILGDCWECKMERSD